MARKQARRRKRKPARRIRLSLPRIGIGVGRLVALPAAVAVVVATYQLSSHLLDRPIESISISGPFQRVTALQIEEAISDELAAGFLAVDLGRVQAKVQALAWVDRATVARRWPSRLEIVVSEQTPAAIWGERGLLNVRGELFVTDLKHLPAELPTLNGPAHRSGEVAERYLEARKHLIPLGQDIRSIELDDRGAWLMTLGNGVEVRLGRRDVNARVALFLDVVASIVTGHAADIDYVDMRYGNGFSIGWKGGAPAPVFGTAAEEQEMLASRGIERGTD